MTLPVTPLFEDQFSASNEVIEITETRTIYVEDLHSHDHDDHTHTHEEGCTCGNCGCETDQLIAESYDPVASHGAITTTQGFSIEVAHTVLPEYDFDWDFIFPTEQAAAVVTASDVSSSDGMMQSGYTSGGDAASSFNIMITYGGDLKGELAEAFSKAADYFSQIILADVADLSSGLDDIEIDATLIEIDGAGSILGRAGPQYVRSSNYLPTEAIMEFDVADAQNFSNQGLWDDIVFHEMLHTLGFGTLWSYMNLSDGSIAGGDMRFNGTHANDVYEDEFASLAAADGFIFGVPIETEGGAGTAGGHWDEGTFENEIMTGYVNGSNFMSWMTIAALEDMGYDTIYDNPYDASDAFGVNPVGDPLSLL